ncbi:MAG: DNA-binding response regulator [Armatimonadetes bacterium RBG_16_67_12]|nr:MAG: DNA-binding response regulator [Armatimonadetes bacterium RBG_16_67_12]
MSGPIRVLVVDDHALVREGIKSLLQGIAEINVIGEAEDGLDAIEKARKLRPDIVLMDIGMPRMTGVEAARHIREEMPAVQVVALTIHESEEYLFQMLRAGASGYVLKKAHPSEMLAAIEAAMRQETYLTPSMAKGLVTDYLRRMGEGGDETTYRELTDREREVLKLIAEGYTNPEIASLLNISVKTVQAHRGHIMEKLDLHRPAALVRYAIRKGLVEAEG